MIYQILAVFSVPGLAESEMRQIVRPELGLRRVDVLDVHKWKVTTWANAADPASAAQFVRDVLKDKFGTMELVVDDVAVDTSV